MEADLAAIASADWGLVMMDGMGSMMTWMMGIGLLGWVLVVALLVTIVVLLVRLTGRLPRDDGNHRAGGPEAGP